LVETLAATGQADARRGWRRGRALEVGEVQGYGGEGKRGEWWWRRQAERAAVAVAAKEKRMRLRWGNLV